MTVQDLHNLKRDLYSKTPLIGGLLRKKAARSLADILSLNAVQALAQTVTDNSDKAVCKIALKALQTLNKAESINEVCIVWESTRHPDLGDLLLKQKFVATHPISLSVLTALQSNQLTLLTNSGPEIVDPLLEACQDIDPHISQNAKQILTHLKNKEAIKILYKLGLNGGHPIGYEIILNAKYLPPTPYYKALLYIVKGQWDIYDKKMAKQYPFEKLYKKCNAHLKNLLIQQAYQSKRLQWIISVIRHSAHAVSDSQWQITFNIINKHQDWATLWLLIPYIPLKEVINYFLQLKKRNWPTKETDKYSLFNIFTNLGQQCTSQPPSLVRLHQKATSANSIIPYPKAIILASNETHYASITWNKNNIAIKSLPDNELVDTLFTKITPQNTSIHPDEKLLIIPNAKTRQTAVYKLPENTLITNLADNSKTINWAAFRAKQNLLITAKGKVINLWQLPNCNLLNTLAHPIWYPAITLSNDGCLLAKAEKGQLITVWKVPECTLITTLRGHSKRVVSLAITPDNKLLISSSSDKTIRLWQLPTGDPFKTLSVSAGYTHIKLSPNGKIFTSLDHSGQRKQGRNVYKICVWTLPDGNLIETIPIYNTTYDLGNKYLIATDKQDKKSILSLWSINKIPLNHISLKDLTEKYFTWATENYYTNLLSKPEQQWLKFALVLSYWYFQDNKNIQQAFYKHLVAEPEEPILQQIAKHTQNIPKKPEEQALFYFLSEQWEKYKTFDFDGRILRVIYQSGNSKIRQKIARKLRKTGRADFLSNITASEADTWATTNNQNEIELLINLLTEQQDWPKLWQLAFQFPFKASVRICRQLASIKWQPEASDEQQLFKTLTTLANQEISLEQIDDLIPLAIQRAKATVPSRINDVAFAPHKPHIAIATGHGKTIVWNFETAQRMLILRAEHSVAKVTFTPKGILFFAERSADNYKSCGVYTWHNQQLTRLGNHRGMVTALEPISDYQVISAGRDHKLILWDVNTKLSEHRTSNWARAACIAPDGKQMAYLHKGVTLLTLPEFTWLTTKKEQRISRQAIFADAGKTLIVGQFSGKVIEYSHTKQGLKQQGKALLYHQKPVQGLQTVLNDSIIISADATGTVKFIDRNNNVLIGQLQIADKHLTSLHISPDEQFMAIGDSNASITLWNLRTLSLCALLKQPLGQAEPIYLSNIVPLLNDTSLSPNIQNTVHYIQAILQHRFRYEIELGEAHDIMMGDFDIEIE